MRNVWVHIEIWHLIADFCLLANLSTFWDNIEMSSKEWMNEWCICKERFEIIRYFFSLVSCQIWEHFETMSLLELHWKSKQIWDYWGLFFFGLLTNLSAFEISSEALEDKFEINVFVSKCAQILSKSQRKHCPNNLKIASSRLELHKKSPHCLKMSSDLPRDQCWDFFWSFRGSNFEIVISCQFWEHFEKLLRFLLKL